MDEAADGVAEVLNAAVRVQGTVADIQIICARKIILTPRPPGGVGAGGIIGIFCGIRIIGGEGLNKVNSTSQKREHNHYHRDTFGRAPA